MPQFPVVLVLGPPENLNGEVLSTIQGELNATRLKAAYLRPTDETQKTLIKYLLGAGGEAFKAAAATFKLATQQQPHEVRGVVVDINLPLGDSFKNGDYTELQELFPNLKSVILCCGNSKIMAASTP